MLAKQVFPVELTVTILAFKWLVLDVSVQMIPAVASRCKLPFAVHALKGFGTRVRVHMLL